MKKDVPFETKIYCHGCHMGDILCVILKSKKRAGRRERNVLFVFFSETRKRGIIKLPLAINKKDFPVRLSIYQIKTCPFPP